MKKPYRHLLGISIVLTLFLFVHDAIYDNPDGPYPFSQIAYDLVFVGGFYTTVFFGILSGVYFLLRKVIGWVMA